MMYREQEPSFRYGFLFPKIWLDTENMQNALAVFSKQQFELIPQEVPTSGEDGR